MHNGIKFIFAFALGAAAGAAVSACVLKTKYERIVQEEIESVKETYAELYSSIENDENPETEASEPSTDADAVKPTVDFTLTDKTRYLNEVRDYSGKESEIVGTAPYEISADEYGEIYEHDCIELVLFADGVLVDDGYEVMDNVDEIVGKDNVCKLKDSSDDSIYVRNPLLKSDYEIVKDVRNYADLDEHDA